MANDLTGDFDVVAQFAVPAVNRILAAMHRIERFQHSFSVRVDDTPPTGTGLHSPALVAAVDSWGDAVADHNSVGGHGHSSGVDAVVNLGSAGIFIEPVVPSNLKGRAQVQLEPPTIEIADSSATQLTVRMGMMSRYLPDPGTPAVAEYIRGSLRISAPVNQVVSQVGKVIDVDIKADSTIVNFTPHWSSKPISSEDLAGIVRLIRNALKTSFVPTNATLPSKISHMQFRTMTGTHGAVAVLLDMEGTAGDPATAHNVLLTSNDGFAIGVSSEYITGAFQPTLDSILTQPIDPVKFDIDAWLHTWHITYAVKLNGASLALQNGKMVLTIQGDARTDTSWLPNFNFTARQDLTLAPSGATAELIPGDLTLNTSSSVANLFRGPAVSAIRKARDRALSESGTQAAVRKMLSADENLGGFLRSLLKPAEGSQSMLPLQFGFEYTSAEIRIAGVLIHGSVSVPAWPPPRVEFEQIPAATGHGGMPPVTDAFAQGPQYSALRSWIPGGAIHRYEWRRQGSTQGSADENRFVYIPQPTAVLADAPAPSFALAYAPMCLTIEGTRISASGPESTQPVGASVCGYSSFPFPGHFEIATGGIAPSISLVRRGADGLVEVTGHVALRADPGGTRSPNMILSFAGSRGEPQLELISDALRESGRADAATAVVAIVTAQQLSQTPFIEGVTFADGSDGVWRRQYGVKSADEQTTIVIAAGGTEVWRNEGPLDARALTSVLAKLLATRAAPGAGLLTARVRIGQPPPNFVFEHSRGLDMTLRKIAGRPATLVFWRSSSPPSVEAVRDASAAGADDAVAFAIDCGESAEKVSGNAHEFEGVTVVPDPEGKISRAYGISIWPTIVSIDALGIVRSIEYGRSRGGKAGA